ncbi:MAG: hypothetical protein K5924_06165 [Chloroflexi bacterium]|nr:hypothetical protein [Chloroflexota bacterium]
MPLFGDLPLVLLTAIFATAAAVVVVSGIILARTGDAIAVQSGLGGLFVGMLLLAGATSLPEIATDVTAAMAGAPDLAIGDLLGSSMANMAILAIIDLLHRGRVWPAIGLGHARVASIAMGLTAILLLGIVTPVRFAIGWIGLETIVLVVGWVLATAWIRRAQTERGPAAPDGELIVPIPADPGTAARPLRRNALVFGGAGLVVLLAAPLMALSAHAIADELGVAQTFVGVTLLALATSLPELATSLAAIRIGAYDLAVGNLFGSNALNTTVVFAADAATTSGPILAAVSTSQAMVAGLGALLLMSIALGGVVHGERTRFQRGEPDAILLLGAYFVMLWVLWNGA